MGIVAGYAVPHPPLIIPDVGRGEERGIQSTIDAYHEVARAVAAHHPDTIVVTSPHAPAYYDYFHITVARRASGSMAQFGQPQVRVDAPYDVDFAEDLIAECADAGIVAGPMGGEGEGLDHATFIPLWFIQQHCEDFSVVRIGLSGFPAKVHYELGRRIARVAERLDRKTVFVASGDLSHKLLPEGPYGFDPAGPVFDRQITEIFASGDLGAMERMDRRMCDDAAECGLRSFEIMAGALEGETIEPRLLSYEGPFGVGYGVASFEVVDDTGEPEEGEV